MNPDFHILSNRPLKTDSQIIEQQVLTALRAIKCRFVALGSPFLKRYPAYTKIDTKRLRKPVMSRFKSTSQAQQFRTAHAVVYNLFNPGRHLVQAVHYRKNRIAAFESREKAVA